jgi:anaerobic magnesium-protoporphyrin IX monomethyl ester cyclase
LSSDALFVSCPVVDRMEDGSLYPTMQDLQKDSQAVAPYLLRGLLRSKNYNCDLFDWVSQPDVSLSEAAGTCANYAVVFLSANSMNWCTIRLLAESIRARRSATRICVGGPHPSMFPRETLKTELFDAIYRGEADRTIFDVYESMMAKKPFPVTGLVLYNSGTVHAPLQREKHLDDLQYPFDYIYDVLPENCYHWLGVETSRGCPNACSFCAISSKGLWRSWNAPEAARRLREALPFANKTKTRGINISDDTFTYDKERVYKIFDLLSESEYSNRLCFDSTIADICDDRLVEAVKPFAGSFLVGAETFDDDEAKKINKPVSAKLIHRAAQVLDRQGLAHKSVFSFIVGFPWETYEHCLRKLEFVSNLVLTYGVGVYFQWYWPIPGSALWRNLCQNGSLSLSTIEEPGFFRNREYFYASHLQLSEKEVAKFHERALAVQTCLNVSGAASSGYHLKYSLPLKVEDRPKEIRHLIW